MQAILALEDGRVFRGKSFGARAECSGEVVFNTSLTGYQEIFTDPSYAGQIVVLTNPHIGNYGTTPSDAESKKPFIEGLVTREFSPMSSNWRSTQVADEYLERYGVPVIAEIDTRAVVRHLRANGVMRGVIASGENLDVDSLVAKAANLDGFFALVPEEPVASLNQLANDVVVAFDRFRAPPTDEEIKRRNPDRMTVSQRRNLEQWGYPYVFEDFRFHMTLTNPVPEQYRPKIEQMLSEFLEPVLEEPVEINNIALFTEARARFPFEIHSLHPLAGTNRRKTA